MNIEEVRKLIQLVEESEIGELEVKRWWGHVRISRGVPNGGAGPVMVTGTFPAGMLAGHSMTSAALAAGGGTNGTVNGTASAALGAPATAGGNAVDETAGLIPIKSPMVGSFYRAPAPDADPYVEPGDRIEVGQTLCIIEAMKLMNEIQSEVRGKVVKVLVGNGQPVEFGQTLFLVDES